jgi:predicted phosphodiesterase
MAQASSGGSVDSVSKEPLFVFATIGDSHVTTISGPDYKYAKAIDRSARLLAAFVRDINAHEDRVSFAVHLGDVTDKGVWSEFKTAREILDSLTCPLYPVVGNHDSFESDNKASWKKFARMDSTRYTFDYLGFHFMVIDCTKDPYTPGAVECDSSLRRWVAEDLAANKDKRAFIFSHYNMWERFWNSQFDTTHHYAEYNGMPQLRGVLEDAGNVVAVINGHVHANRVEEHNGIFYIDVGATLVGRPSVRYFSIFPDRMEASFAYISDRDLLDYVVKVSQGCTNCFDRASVADYADGEAEDKRFAVMFK